MSKQMELKLPESELEIMLILWNHKEPVRTAQIMEEIPRDWSQSTVKALLTRLADKKMIEVTRQGRFTLYRALVEEEAFRKKETQGLLRRYYKNSVKSMVAALVNEVELSGSDLQELEEIIKKAGR